MSGTEYGSWVAKPRVLMLGPTAPAVGGMATVVDQLLSGPLSECVDLQVFPCNSSGEATRSALRSIRRHLARAAELARTIRREQIDIVHIHTCSGFTFFRNVLDGQIAKRCGAAVILHVHGAQFDAFCAGANRWQRAMIQRGMESADRIVVLSQHWQRLLSPYAASADFEVVPNGVAMPDRAATGSERCVRPPGPCRFLFLAAICRRKGIDVLVEAATELIRGDVPWHLTIAGPEESAGEAQWLRAAIESARLGDCVSYVGAATGQAKDALLTNCDCMVLPSRAEGLPLTLLEAGARGLAVIASVVGAIPEVIDGPELGCLVPPGSVPSLAEAMSCLAAHPEERHRLGCNLQQRVRQCYSLEGQSAALETIYLDVLATRRAAARNKRPLLAGVEM